MKKLRQLKLNSYIKLNFLRDNKELSIYTI